MKTIVISPGHGGKDRYNIGYSGKYIEADGNLEFSLYLKEELQDFFNVILTREVDKTLSLTERGKIAIKNNADMFLSVHSDAWLKTSNGVTIFDSVDLDNTDIANKIGQACADAMGIKFNGHRERQSKKYPGEDYYTVIDVAQDGGVPVVLLLERGFHSNPYEEKLLIDSDIVKKSAIAVANEIKKYYGVVDTTDVQEKSWEQKLGEKAIDNLVAKGLINNPELWKSKDLKNEATPLWLFFKLYNDCTNK